jgi:hypothetical protein
LITSGAAGAGAGAGVGAGLAHAPTNGTASNDNTNNPATRNLATLPFTIFSSFFIYFVFPPTVY